MQIENGVRQKQISASRDTALQVIPTLDIASLTKLDHGKASLIFGSLTE